MNDDEMKHHFEKNSTIQELGCEIATFHLLWLQMILSAFTFHLQGIQVFSLQIEHKVGRNEDDKMHTRTQLKHDNFSCH